jgi:hypothetical protein
LQLTVWAFSLYRRSLLNALVNPKRSFGRVPERRNPMMLHLGKLGLGVMTILALGGCISSANGQTPATASVCPGTCSETYQHLADVDLSASKANSASIDVTGFREILAYVTSNPELGGINCRRSTGAAVYVDAMSVVPEFKHDASASRFGRTGQSLLLGGRIRIDGKFMRLSLSSCNGSIEGTVFLTIVGVKG